MGFIDKIKDIFGKDAVSDTNQNLEQEKEFVGTGGSLLDKSPYADSLYKAYIPNFLYKPYFGYPLNINVVSLKKLARNPYVFAVQKTIIDQVSTAKYDLEEREDVEVPENIKEFKTHFLRWIDDANVNEESFNYIRRMWSKDLLDLDAGVLVKVFNRLGQLRQIFVRAGGSFLKNPDIYGTVTNKKAFILPSERIPFAAQYTPSDGIIQQYATQFKETAAYFQYSYTSNALPVPFGTREIIYSMLNPNTDVIYGISPIQMLEDTLFTLIYGNKYNLDYYSNRNTPNGILQLAGIEKDEIDAVRKRMNEQFKIEDDFGKQRTVNGQIPITDREVNYVNFGLKPAELEIIAQQKWFSKLVWAVYAANANELGITEDSNKAVAQNQTSNIKRKVLEPIFDSMSYYITTEIMNEEILYINSKGEKIVIPPLNDFYKFKFDDFDIDKEIKRRELFKLDLELGVKTSRMIAEELGLDYDKVEEEQEKQREIARKEMEQAQSQSDEQVEKPENLDQKEEPEKNEVKAKNPATVTKKEVKDEFSPLTDFIKEKGKQLIEVLKEDGNSSR